MRKCDSSAAAAAAAPATVATAAHYHRYQNETLFSFYENCKNPIGQAREPTKVVAAGG